MNAGETMFPPRAPFFDLDAIARVWWGFARAKPGSARGSAMHRGGGSA